MTVDTVADAWYCACVKIKFPESGDCHMGLLPDTPNCRLRMHQECRERFPRHQFQRKTLASDPGTHRGTCVTHVPWCMLGSITRGGGENVPGIHSACAIRDFAYLVRGPYLLQSVMTQNQREHCFLSLFPEKASQSNQFGRLLSRHRPQHDLRCNGRN